MEYEVTFYGAQLWEVNKAFASSYMTFGSVQIKSRGFKDPLEISHHVPLEF